MKIKTTKDYRGLHVYALLKGHWVRLVSISARTAINIQCYSGIIRCHSIHRAEVKYGHTQSVAMSGRSLIVAYNLVNYIRFSRGDFFKDITRKEWLNLRDSFVKFWGEYLEGIGTEFVRAWPTGDQFFNYEDTHAP